MEDALNLGAAVLTTAGFAVPVLVFTAWITYYQIVHGRWPVSPSAMYLLFGGVLLMVSQKMWLDKISEGDFSGPAPGSSARDVEGSVAFLADHYGTPAIIAGYIAGLTLGAAGVMWFTAQPTDPVA